MAMLCGRSHGRRSRGYGRIHLARKRSTPFKLTRHSETAREREHMRGCCEAVRSRFLIMRPRPTDPRLPDLADLSRSGPTDRPAARSAAKFFWVGTNRPTDPLRPTHSTPTESDRTDRPTHFEAPLGRIIYNLLRTAYIRTVIIDPAG